MPAPGRRRQRRLLDIRLGFVEYGLSGRRRCRRVRSLSAPKVFWVATTRKTAGGFLPAGIADSQILMLLPDIPLDPNSHAINLTGANWTWELSGPGCETLCWRGKASDPAVPELLAEAIRSPAGPVHSGRTLGLERTFHWPTGLQPTDHLWLVIEPRGGLRNALLNGRTLSFHGAEIAFIGQGDYASAQSRQTLRLEWEPDHFRPAAMKVQLHIGQAPGHR